MVRLLLVAAAVAVSLAAVCSPLCDLPKVGDGVCDLPCMTASCSFDAQSSLPSDCISICLTSGCLSSLLGDGTCDSVCDTQSCAWDFGDCGECAQHCYGDLLGNGICDPVCNQESCRFDQGDCVSETNPVRKFVEITANSYGTGTRDDPYDSVTKALAAIWAKFTVIFIGAGVFSLSSDRPFIEIAADSSVTLFGSDSVLQLSPESIPLIVRGKLYIEGLTLRGNFSLVPGCDLPQCRYCPSLTYDQDTDVWVNDRGQLWEGSPIAKQAVCDSYQDFSLMTVKDSALLVVSNATFEGIRHQPNAVVLSECGDIQFRNVTIRDCQARYNDSYTGIVKQTHAFDKTPYYCGSFQYIDGLVEYLNNGYEFASSLGIGGAIAVVGMRLVEIDSVLFRKNNVYAKSSNGSLTFVRDCREIRFRNASFDTNIANFHAGISIESEVDLRIVEQDGVSVEHSLSHIEITKCRFANNTSARASATIAVEFRADPLNVLISDSVFVNNFAGEEGLISLQSENLVTEYADLWVDPHSQATIPAIRTIISLCRFSSNYATSVAYLAFIPSVTITNSVFTDNGESLTDVTAILYTIDNFVTDSYAYISLFGSVQFNFHCAHMLFVTSVSNLTFYGNEILIGNCPKGSPGLTQTANNDSLVSSQLYIRDLQYWGNIGQGLLTLAPTSDLVLSNLTYENNTVGLAISSVCFNISPQEAVEVTVEQSRFRLNVGQTAVLGSFSSLAALTVRQVTAEHNYAYSASAGFLFNPAEAQASQLSFYSCVFRNNTSSSDGVITAAHLEGASITENGKLMITISDCTFEDNHSGDAGGAINVAYPVGLSATSLISNSTFRRNTAIETGGGIYLAYVSGQLTIASSIFLSNTAKLGSALYSKHHNANTQSEQPQLTLRALEFTNHISDCTMYLDGAGFFSQTWMVNNRFENNTGSCFEASEALVDDTGSQYVGNSNSIGGVAHVHDRAKLRAERLIAEKNTAGSYGGALYITGSASVSCFSCSFSNNTANLTGGAVYLDQSSFFSASNSRFASNKCGKKGAALFVLYASVSLFNSSITQNFAGEQGAIALTSSVCLFTQSTMSANTHSGRSAGLSLSLSSLFVSNSSFCRQTAKEGAFIFALDSSTISVENSIFDSGISEHSGGAIYVCLSVTLSVQNATFRNCQSSLGAAVYALRECAVAIAASSFTNLTSYFSEGALFGNDAEISVVDSQFSNITGGAVFGELLTNVSLQGSTFTDISASRGSGICCWSCIHVLVSDSLFQRLTSSEGGVIFMASNSETGATQTLVIGSSGFEDNSAGIGGCISITNVNADVESSRFLRNAAVITKSVGDSGSAGVFSSSCLGSSSCRINFTGNRFEGNRADRKCGAICWNDSVPTFTENHFGNNSAKYAPDVGSLPMQLRPIAASHAIIPFQNSTSVPPLAVTIAGFCSGQVFDGLIRLALFDHQFNVYTVDSSTSAEFSPAMNSSGYAYGNIKLIASEGVFDITGITISGPPGTVQEFVVTAAGIEESGEDVIKAVSIAVEFRDCLPGEALQDGVCHECTKGTYSFSPSDPCAVCPPEAMCNGGLEVGPRTGYWRAETMTATFFRCPNAAACEGAETIRGFSLSGWCTTGYTGNLCNVCESGYSKTSKYACERCPQLETNVCLTTLLCLFALCVLALFIAISVRGAQRARSELPILMKILMNYVQVIMICAGLNLHWPNYVKSFLVAQELMGNMAEQIFSLDCFYQDVPSMDSFYMKLTVMSSLPALLFLLCIFSWMALSRLRAITLLRDKVQASVVMVLFMLHPTLSNSALSLFSCVELRTGEFWLEASMSVKCWNASHIKFVLALGIPSIAVWIVGLPMLCFVEIMRNRKFLSDEKIRMRYSFIYKGYGHSHCYWEFVILYRKTLLVSATVFFATISTTVQALSVLAVGLVALFFQVYTCPFLEAQHNRLETKALIVSCVTIFAGLYYQTQDLNLYASATLFAVMLAANSLFLSDWLQVVFPILLSAVRDRLKSLKKPYRVHNDSGFLPKSTPEPGDITADMSKSRVEGTPSPSIDITPPMNTSMIVDQGQFTFPKDSPSQDKV